MKKITKNSLYPRNLSKKGKNNFTIKLFMLPMKKF